MPHINETRTSNGETRSWTGVEWVPLNPDPTDYAGGVMKSLGTTAKDTVEGVGAAFNPMTILKGLVGLPGQIVSGYGDLAKLVGDPALLKEIPSAIKQGVTDLSDPHTGGQAIGNLMLAGLTGRLGGPAVSGAGKIGGAVGRAAEAVATPALNIGEHLPWAGPVIKATRTEIPAMLEGLKKVASPETSVLKGRDQYRPDAQYGGDTPTPSVTPPSRSSVSQEIPYRMGGSVQPEAPVSPYQRMKAQGAFDGDRSTGHFTPGANSMAPESTYITDIQAGDANVPGITVGDPLAPPLPSELVPVSRAKQASDAMQRQLNTPDLSNPSFQKFAQSDEPALSPNVREIPRYDEQWGPGSTTKAGLPSQADTAPANLKYDPQTPTDYLRQQLQEATDPAEREFLANSLAQRSSIDRAKVATAPLQAHNPIPGAR